MSHKHYVPVLRWKQAEWLAIRELERKHCKLITPLFEPTPHHFDKKHNNEINTAADLMITNLKKSWPSHPFFLDPHLIFNIERKEHVLETIFAKISKANLALIPVSSLSCNNRYNLLLKKLIKKHRRGLCIRVDIASCELSKLKKSLEALCGFFSLAPKQIDLIIDYKLIPHRKPHPTFSSLCKSLPHLHLWRSFTTLSGVFPKYLSDFSVDIHRISRSDWLMWKNRVSATLPRLPAFGDYTILHPFFTEPVPGARPSASLRYTSEVDWLLFRGEGLNKKGGAGHAQYPAHAQLLIERPDFMGKNFSAGDAYIYDMAQKAEQEEEVKHPGNPASWLRAGINHHLTLVATQLSNLGVNEAGL